MTEKNLPTPLNNERIWTLDETKAFLEVFKSRKIELNDIKKEKEAYKNMLKDLLDMNSLKTPADASQLEEKMKDLMKEYKIAKDEENKSGLSTSLFPFINEMDTIFNGKKRQHKEPEDTSLDNTTLDDTSFDGTSTSLDDTSLGDTSTSTGIFDIETITKKQRLDILLEQQKVKLETAKVKLEIEKEKQRHIKEKRQLISLFTEEYKSEGVSEALKKFEREEIEKDKQENLEKLVEFTEDDDSLYQYEFKTM